MEHPIYSALLPHVEADRIKDFSRYFQNYEGGYGEGDVFMGVMVPLRRQTAKEHGATWDQDTLASGLAHPVHEVRHTALFATMQRFVKERKRRGFWHQFLLDHYDGINNWDLVDTCAHKVFGRWAVETGDTSALTSFLESTNVWHQRTALVATLWHQKTGDIQTTLSYCPAVAENAPDILQKAIGWVLKTAWQQDPVTTEEHLALYYREGLYTRLIVRITLEKASKEHRNDFLSLGY